MLKSTIRVLFLGGIQTAPGEGGPLQQWDCDPEMRGEAAALEEAVHVRTKWPDHESVKKFVKESCLYYLRVLSPIKTPCPFLRCPVPPKFSFPRPAPLSGVGS